MIKKIPSTPYRCQRELQRLARKLLKLDTKQDDQKQTRPLTIVVIGGSVSTGLSDRINYKDFFNVAYARKIE